MPRKSKYRYGKRTSYRSFTKRKSNEDAGVLLLALLLVGSIVMYIIGIVIQVIVTYYYIFIILFIIGIILYLKNLDNKKLKTSMFGTSSDSREGNIIGDICNDPNKAILKNSYSKEKNFLPEYYNGEPSTRQNNLEASHDPVDTSFKNSYSGKEHSSGYYNGEPSTRLSNLEASGNPEDIIAKENHSEEIHFSSEFCDESSVRLNNLKNYEVDSAEDLNDQKSNFNSSLQLEYSEKGDTFERYIADRFNDRFFSIVEWTTDMSRKHNRFVESDCNPDLVVRDRKTNDVFCVECKYRSRLVNGYFKWSYPDQMDRYFSYARERKIPFYAVLGLGGGPDSPSEVFCVPLEEAKSPQIHINTLQKYRHNPRGDFLWIGQRLK